MGERSAHLESCSSRSELGRWVLLRICTNDDCGAYSSMVIIPWGQTNFDFYYDEHKSACPLCKKHVRPITCGFNNTWWKYSGSKKVGSGHPPQSVSSDWEYAKDGYHYFDREKCGEVDWGRLKLFVSSKDPSVTRSEFESS
ncbi:hypothetical protein BC938DRAFT_483622 [Jimgerdemannia flammicorona]|uniref:Uncharacterized protein n=1 Tax=Jimgerdemannia flammicorona TaxID=994334 RepID=A0A433QBL8_9FUNG|nr:hypothetical protein BC938DRAFT_483622 [Jimgerdemannia flammicorona]